MLGSMATRRPSMAAEGLRMGAIWLSRARSMRRGGGVEGGPVVVCGRRAGSRDAARPEMRLLAGAGVGRGCLSVGGSWPSGFLGCSGDARGCPCRPRPSVGQIGIIELASLILASAADSCPPKTQRSTPTHSRGPPGCSTSPPDSLVHRCGLTPGAGTSHRPRSVPLPKTAARRAILKWPS